MTARWGDDVIAEPPLSMTADLIVEAIGRDLVPAERLALFFYARTYDEWALIEMQMTEEM